MNFYKRGSVWWVRFSHNGEEFRMSCNTRKKTEAEAFADRMKIVRKAGNRENALKMVDIWFPPERAAGTPFATAWETYVEVARSTGMDKVGKRTLYTRRQTLSNFAEWLKRNSPRIRNVEEVDGPIAGKYAAYLSTRKTHKGTPLSEKSRANIIHELATVWTMLGKTSALIVSPWEGLVPKGGKKNRRPAFTREQERAVLEAARQVGKGWELACLIARHTGLRYGDVANLTWDDVDMDRRTIGHSDAELVLRKTARHGITVLLPICDELYAALDACSSREGYVLPNHAALYGNTSESAYRQLNFREVLDRAGIGEEWTFHSWRHTFRSRLAEAGVDIETAKRLVGHTNDETSRHYDHATHLDEYRRAIDSAARV